MDFFDRVDLPKDVQLRGDATLENGVVKLTKTRHHDQGSLIMRGADPWPWVTFDLTAQVYVGGGDHYCTYDPTVGRICGGEGFSFLYGLLPLQGLGQLGAGSGLRVQFSTTPHRHQPRPTIVVSYDNVVVHVQPWEQLVRGSWLSLRIGYRTVSSPHGLLIEHAGQVSVRNLAIPDFVPTEGWSMALAAHTGDLLATHR